MGLTFEPVIPLWLLIMMGVVSLAIIGWSFRRSGLIQDFPVMGRVLPALKLLAILGVLTMLARPQWNSTRTRTEPATLLALVDYSESMNIRDEDGNRTRFETARRLLGERLEEPLQDRYDLRLFGFSSFLRPVTTADLVGQEAADGNSTDIGGSLLAALRGLGSRRPIAVILATDGVHNTGTEPNQITGRLKGMNVPVFAVGLGGERQYRDVELNEAIVPQLVFEKENVTLGVDLTAYGFQDQEIEVKMVLEGITEQGVALRTTDVDLKTLERQQVEMIGRGFRQRVEFQYQPEDTGDHHLLFEVIPMPQESVDTNNRLRSILSVSKKQMRVLIIEGRPRWITGRVARTLRSDPRLIVDTLTRIDTETNFFLPIGRGFIEKDIWGNNYAERIFPLDPPFGAYDCIILGDIPPSAFAQGALEKLAKEIDAEEKGILFIAGEDTFHDLSWGTSPLAETLPVILIEPPVLRQTETPFRITPRGAQHPLMKINPSVELNRDLWSRVPSGTGFIAVEQPRIGAVALAEHPTERNAFGQYPLAVYKRVGEGRSMAWMFEDAWMWALAQDEQLNSRQFFDRFWRGAVRYLVSGVLEEQQEGVRLEISKNRLIKGELVDLKAYLVRQSPDPMERVYFEVTAPNGLTERLQAEPRRLDEESSEVVFMQRVRADQVGEYVLKAVLSRDGIPVSEDRETIQVEQGSFEQRSAGLNADLLRALAAQTAGKYYTSRDAGSLLEDLPSSERVVTLRRRIELWNAWPLFLGLVVAMNLEWILRKWKDLN